MQNYKWMIKLSEYFDLNRRQQVKNRKNLKEILKKLSAKEKKLRAKLKSEKDKDKQKMLTKQIKIIHAQRNKGIKTLRAQEK